jgi:hypothetical protein
MTTPVSRGNPTTDPPLHIRALKGHSDIPESLKSAEAHFSAKVNLSVLRDDTEITIETMPIIAVIFRPYS